MIETNMVTVIFKNEIADILVRYGWDMVVPQIGSKVSFSPYNGSSKTDTTLPEGKFLVMDVEYNYRAYDNCGGINKKTDIVIKCKKLA